MNKKKNMFVSRSGWPPRIVVPYSCVRAAERSLCWGIPRPHTHSTRISPWKKATTVQIELLLTPKFKVFKQSAVPKPFSVCYPAEVSKEVLCEVASSIIRLNVSTSVLSSFRWVLYCTSAIFFANKAIFDHSCADWRLCVNYSIFILHWLICRGILNMLTNILEGHHMI